MTYFQSARRSAAVLALTFAANSPLFAQSFQSFVPVTPCRIVDTRNTGGPFGARETRNFSLANVCGLPSNAGAYSINVTVVPAGTLGFLTIWPAGSAQPLVSTLNDGQGVVLANAAIVPAGSGGAISVFATNATDVILDVNGYFTSPSSGSNSNTSLGLNALPINSGGANTAVGFGALGANSSGNFNTGVGTGALSNNSTGGNNTGIGQNSLNGNTSGVNNTSVGVGSLTSASGATDDTAVGYNAMNGATGTNSVAVGSGALSFAAGNNNIAVGYQAGNSITIGSNNIDIGNSGTSSDNGVIRIGAGTQGSAFIAGISGANVGGSSMVFINSNGQLGTLQSSRRYKEDIHPMADASDKLMLLEPVTFRYKQVAADGTKDLQYGLIAEQVAGIYPELVIHNKDGQIESVQYQQLPAMLLNEIQKQHRTIEDLEARIASLEQFVKASQSTSASVAGH